MGSQGIADGLQTDVFELHEPAPVTNATIDLENENDNSEVGKAVALIKDAIGSNTPLVIVTHLAKAVSRGSVDDVSPRGASAWSGDVNAVQYVIKDDALENERFLLLGKRRFEAGFTEIRFETRCYIEVLDTPQGVPQEIPIRYAEAFKSSRNSRDNAKQEAQRRARQEREVGLRQALLDATKEIQRSGKPCITRNALAHAVGGKKQTALEMIDRLIEDGQLTEEPLPAGVKAPSNRTNKTIRLVEPDYRTYANRDEV